MKYAVVLWSNSSLGREYETDSMSAVKAGYEFGRCELGEVVVVCRKRTRQVLSKAEWSPQLKKYLHVYVGKRRAEYI